MCARVNKQIKIQMTESLEHIQRSAKLCLRITNTLHKLSFIIEQDVKLRIQQKLSN